jgi:Fe-S oxidoreductase
VDTPAGDMQKAVTAFETHLNRKLAAGLEACLHCAHCKDSCLFHMATGEAALLPGKRLQLLSRAYFRRKSLPGQLLSLLGLRKALVPDMDELARLAYESCTMCGRCETFCMAGINVGEILFLARSMLSAAGKTPPGLSRTLDLALSSGNSMAITQEDFLETREWLSEELVDEYGEQFGRMPVDERGAVSLYLVNPREVKFFPLSLQAAAKVLNAAGESWTLSTGYFDVTNYGYFAGDPAAAGWLAGKAIEAAKKLGCRRIVASECGHGFNALRWEASRWLKKRPDIEVVSIVEVLDTFLAENRITVDASRNPRRTTLHDPCNLVRRGGVVEPQRRVLDRVASDWVEMEPNRKYNYCCGGGGGMRSLDAQKELSLRAARFKAEQIRATGAEVVAAPCHTCIDQLEDVSKEYNLEVKLTTLVELVAEALVIEGKGG